MAGEELFSRKTSPAAFLSSLYPVMPGLCRYRAVCYTGTIHPKEPILATR
jgi:hypothetical protein